MAERIHAWAPRAMSEEVAAYYLSLSVSSFRTEVACKRAPQPIWLTMKRKAWLKDDLDAWLDRRSGRTPSTEDDEWQRAIDGGFGGTTLP